MGKGYLEKKGKHCVRERYKSLKESQFITTGLTDRAIGSAVCAVGNIQAEEARRWSLGPRPLDLQHCRWTRIWYPSSVGLNPFGQPEEG